MGWAKRVWTACALGACLAVGGHAQVETGPATVEDALRAMAQQAAVIFAGQVVAVRRRDGVAGAAGVVEIDFAVEDSVRGVSGGAYTLREWAGLWPAGEQRFRVGERYLMLLHGSGRGELGQVGLSSPVGGADGAIPIRGGPGLAGPGRGSVEAVGDSRTVDLRWVATRVVRPLAYRTGMVASGTARPVPARAKVMTGAGGTGAVVGDGSATATADTVSYIAVMALLRGWQEGGDAAR